MANIDFLKPDTNQIRHQIRGILDSYSHEWDIFAELAQNSVDAIRLANRARGHIQIDIDATKRQIAFSDNGIGIAPKELAILLRPFGTNKVGKSNQVGEKGVGLTFVIFSSSNFEIATAHESGKCSAHVKNAAAWLDSTESNNATFG